MLPSGPPKVSHRDFDPSTDMTVDEDFEMRSESTPGGVDILAVEINILIYLYLLESDFSHTAFTFLSESNLPTTALFQHFNPAYPRSSKPKSNGSGNANANGSAMTNGGGAAGGKNIPAVASFGTADGKIERGELVRKLWKAACWDQVERHLAPNGEAYKQTCPNPFHLVIPHVCPPSLASAATNPTNPPPASLLRPSPAPSRPEAFPPPPEPQSQPVAGPSRTRGNMNGDRDKDKDKEAEKEKEKEKDETSNSRSNASQTAAGLIGKGKGKPRRNSNASADTRNPSPARSNSPIKGDNKRKEKQKKRSRMGDGEDRDRRDEDEEPRKKGRGRRAMIESEPEREETPDQGDALGNGEEQAETDTAKLITTSASNATQTRGKSPLKPGPQSEILRLASQRGVGNPVWAKDHEIGLFTEHRDVINCLAWNPKNGNSLASGSGDGTAKLWEFEAVPELDLEAKDAPKSECKALQSIKKPTNVSHKSIESNKKAVTVLSWHPDGTILATGCQDGVGRLSTPSGQLQGIMSYGRGAVLALKFSPDGSSILMAKADFTTTLWAVGTDYNQRVRMTFDSHTKEVNDVDWYDDHVFASASNDHSIFVHRTDDRRPCFAFKGHTDDVTRIVWSPAPPAGAHTQTPGDVKPKVSGKEARNSEPTRHPRLLASASDDGTVKIWRLPYYPESKGTPATSNQSQSPGREDHKEGMANSGPGTGMGMGRAGDEGWNEGIPGREDCLHTLVVAGDGVVNKRMNSLAWSPSSNGTGRMIVAAGGLDTTIKLFDALSGECLHVLEGLAGGTGTLAFAPLDLRGDGLIAGGGWNSDLFVWDVKTGKKLKQYGLEEDKNRQATRDKPMMMSMAWREDGRHIAIGMQNKALLTICVDDLLQNQVQGDGKEDEDGGEA